MYKRNIFLFFSIFRINIQVVGRPDSWKREEGNERRIKEREKRRKGRKGKKVNTL